MNQIIMMILIIFSIFAFALFYSILWISMAMKILSLIKKLGKWIEKL